MDEFTDHLTPPLDFPRILRHCVFNTLTSWFGWQRLDVDSTHSLMNRNVVDRT